MCLAAAHHDIGWMQWEQRPKLNSETGFPYDFMHMPVEEHLSIWNAGSRSMQSISRYAALLVALHNAFLAGIHDFSENSKAEERAIRDFFLSERQQAESLKESLGSVPAYQPYLQEDVLERNRRLIGAWDYLSLMLCMGLEASVAVPKVPLKGRELQESMELKPIGGDVYTLNPWPFTKEQIELRCESIRLTGAASAQAELDRMMAGASRPLLRFVLRAS